MKIELKKHKEPKIKAAVDLLLAGEKEFSNILAKDGLIKQLTKSLLESVLKVIYYFILRKLAQLRYNCS